MLNFITRFCIIKKPLRILVGEKIKPNVKEIQVYQTNSHNLLN
jgi:hypothetical protein